MILRGAIGNVVVDLLAMRGQQADGSTRIEQQPAKNLLVLESQLRSVRTTAVRTVALGLEDESREIRVDVGIDVRIQIVRIKMK